MFKVLTLVIRFWLDMVTRCRPDRDEKPPSEVQDQRTRRGALNGLQKIQAVSALVSCILKSQCGND